MKVGGTVRLNRRGWVVAGCTLVVLGLVWHRSLRVARYSGAQLVRDAVLAAQAGGHAVLTAGGGGQRSKGLTREGAEQPVTAADEASHCAMTAVLNVAFPAARLVSEETVVCPSHSHNPDPVEDPLISRLSDELISADDITIWIDPLDATQEFTEKLYDYVTTMVCIAIKGVPAIGVIYKPYTKETTWAWVSKGVSENIKNPQSDNSERESVVIVSRSHKGKVESFASSAFGSHFKIVPAGGAGYKVLEVVHGRADVYTHTTLIKKWDICAGNAILNALGGKMTTLKNETIDYSYDSGAANNGGLLASMKNHDMYIEKSQKINT